jgi:uncharacterized membrane protein YqhA
MYTRPAMPGARDNAMPSSPSPTDQHQPDDNHELHWGDPATTGEPKLEKLSGAVVTTRFGISLSIVGVALSCFAMLIYCLVVLGRTVYHAFFETSYDMDGAKHLAVELIELTDFFLLGMVLYVVALGMFQLFINPDIPVPDWMRVGSLNDLKSQVINVVVVLLVVTFLASVITWNGDQSVIYFGAALAFVIIAVSVYTYVHNKTEH